MRKTFLALAVLLAVSGPAAAQRSHVGVHAGYDFDRDVALAGGQLSLPLSRFVELYPSADVYFVSSGSLLGLNGDLKLRLRPGAPLQTYVGGGVNFLSAHPQGGGPGATDTGWDLFVGFESRRGYVHPYLEGRVQEHTRSVFHLLGGLNITLF
ncbi:MAG TPA: hypothetical protein VFK78_06255 [Gemmatimonadales bacterium]|nr:hypothetical protein [Gemmatimonadales bacterium]